MAFMGNDIFRDSRTGAAVIPQGSIEQRLAAQMFGPNPNQRAPAGFQMPGVSQLAQMLAMQANRVPGSVLNNLPSPPPAQEPRMSDAELFERMERMRRQRLRGAK